jgi:hypothetical protein
MFIAVDACHAGTLGPALEAREIEDVVLFTAANGWESSLAANYAPKVETWVADEFSFGLSLPRPRPRRLHATRAPPLADASIPGRRAGLSRSGAR